MNSDRALQTNSLPAPVFQSAQLERIRRVRQRSINAASLNNAERIEKIYGSEAAYEACKREHGMTEEHAARFEDYGVILQPKQIEFAVWGRRADSPSAPHEIGMGGARGPGKSFGAFAQVALDDCQRFPGLKVLYLRKTGKSAKEQLEDLVLAVLGKFLYKEVTANRIQFANGSRIVLGGFKDDKEALKYQGVEYDIILIEEATQLAGSTYTALRLSERSSKTFNGMAWQPRTYVTFNPLGIGHQFFKKHFVDPERKGGIPERKFIFGTVHDNVFVNESYIRNLQALTGAQRRAYLEGDWDVSAGAYFDTYRYNLHVIRPIRNISWMSQVWMAMDYGFNHWNMTYLVGEDGDGNRYSLDELAHRKMRPPQIAPEIHNMLSRYGLTTSDLSWFFVGTDVFNKTGAAQFTIAEQYQNLGIYLTPAETSPGSRTAGAHYLAEMLGDIENGIDPRWFITQNCPRLIDTLPYMEVNPNRPEDILKVNADEQGVGGDDPIDATRYAFWIPHASRIA